MIDRNLIIPFRRHTLRECDEIIKQASGVSRKGKAWDGSVKIVACTVDWHETYRLRDNDEITKDDIAMLCGHCLAQCVFDIRDSGDVTCPNCKRKLIWKEKPHEHPNR